MGLTKVFFQQKAFNSIEKLRTSIVARSATIIQTFWRGVSARRAYLIRKGLLAAGDGSRRLRGLAACRIQRLARRYIWSATKNRREAAARAEREAQLVAEMEEVCARKQKRFGIFFLYFVIFYYKEKKKQQQKKGKPVVFKSVERHIPQGHSRTNPTVNRIQKRTSRADPLQIQKM